MNINQRYTYYSIGLHLSLVLIAILLGKRIQSIEESNKDFNIKLVQSSVRVDMVSMPKLTFKELQALESTPVETQGNGKVETSEPKEVVADNEEAFEKAKSKVSFNDLLNKYKNTNTQKSKNAKDEGKGKGNLDQGVKNSLKDLVLAGNKLSQGTAYTGGRGGNGEVANVYLGRLPEHVRPLWKLPSFLMNKDLRCRIRVFLSANGSILNAIVFESSGDKEYDKRALDAVKSASPFPPLPTELVSSGAKGEIVLGFPL